MDKQIKDLTENTTLNDNDVIPLQDTSNYTRKFKISTLISKLVSHLLGLTVTSSVPSSFLGNLGGSLLLFSEQTLFNKYKAKNLDTAFGGTGATGLIVLNESNLVNFFYVQSTQSSFQIQRGTQAAQIGHCCEIVFRNAIATITHNFGTYGDTITKADGTAFFTSVSAGQVVRLIKISSSAWIAY